ncbi:response regulator transcription factor [Pantoea sp. PNT02]|uniref:LuxR C-terminal-related transcriptional regulator n=1 Tax=Pantoea sp. PNT02 TaxID=2769261 RepID=UPI0017848A34|nr:response regulator transcription factor [Pantoea sp. PNT02]
MNSNNEWNNVIIIDRNRILSEEKKNELNLLNNNNSTYIEGFEHDISKYLEDDAKNIIILTCKSKFEIIDARFFCRSLAYSPYSVSLIIVCPHEHCDQLEGALIDGVKGFYTSSCTARDIMTGVELINRGYPAVSSFITNKKLYQTPHLSNDQLQSVVKLTNAEKRVLNDFLTGMKITEIAEKYQRSSKTISSQKIQACEKLGLKNDFQLYEVKLPLLMALNHQPLMSLIKNSSVPV